MHLRPDWAPALVAMLLANIHRDPKSQSTYELKDFLVGELETFEQTPEQMALVAELTAATLQAADGQQLGGTD